MEERSLYEEVAKPSDLLQIKCIKENAIDELSILLENEFIKVLNSEEVAQAKNITIKNTVPNIIANFRKLANIYHIAKLKMNKFSHHKNAIIKIG
ncbi:hypothetical protein TI05_03720 [Achromatium sp. WMS3]|nr:hypothetical protein TI05_03720 [Achromatium sp. WMS3]